MSKEKTFENYKFAKMSFQMIGASLADVTINKYRDDLKGDYKNDISFEIRTEKRSEDEYRGYLKTAIHCMNAATEEVELYIEVVYSGDFKTTKQLEEYQMIELVEAQIVPQLLSYSRSLITHLTSLMNIPSILLPTIDVIESLENNNHLNGGGNN
jgi:preprotein translocase subunit SecB